MAGRIEKRGEESYRLTAYGGYDDKGSCYCKSKSVTINAYYKMQQMLDEGKDPKDIERAKDILRFEI